MAWLLWKLNKLSVPGKEPQQGLSTSPTIQKKEIESFVAVKDGETIVLGGLIDDDNTANKAGIPFLYDLPWIGPLFGNTLIKEPKTNWLS